MFSFHKPKIYRSINGCCICRAKSSSSRFTDSIKYETEFERCFRIKERRAGEICNACVLLVKRWKKLPDGTNRHWNHVVDARAGPGTKSTLKIKNKNPSMNKYKSPLKSKRSVSSAFRSSPSPSLDDLAGYDDSLDKSDIFSRNTTDSEDSDNEENRSQSHHLSRSSRMHKQSNRHISKKTIPDMQISPFLDLTYWKKTQVCCGIIFKGLNGEVLVDPKLLKPCRTCRTEKPRPPGELRRSTSLDDTDSNSSTPSYGVMDFYDTHPMEQETPPESPPTSLEETEASLALTALQCAATKMEFTGTRTIAMEC